ncbi:unnamed protein product [Boreogadus saida]
MQEVGCVASPGDLLLKPTVCNQPRNPWLKELMEEAVLKALPGGGADGGPAWCRMSVLGPGLCLRRADGGAEKLEDD